MSYQLAIDFGTTNSVIACRETGQSQVCFATLPGLSAPGPLPLAPSLLYVQDGRTGEALLGQAVLEQGLHARPTPRFFRSFKRAILGSAGAPPRLLDGAPWTDQDAGRRFLRGLLEALPFRPDQIEQLIVTAPVGAFDGYLTWLNEGLRGLTPEQIRLVDESTAAALGYAITEPGATLLVFDFGGGSLDVSLVQLPQSREQAGGWLRSLAGKSTRQHTARVVAKSGVNLGGSDVDGWLLAEVLHRLGQPVSPAPNATASLLTACEQAKIALSSVETVDLCLPLVSGEAGRQASLRLTRLDLENLLEAHGFYASIQRLLDRVMHVAQRQGIFREDVHYVLMVGGASLMPSVQQLLRRYFSEQAVRVDRPFTAIAEGALSLATGCGLDDYLLHSYGLRYLDPRTGQPAFDEIVAMGSRYPSPKPVEVRLAAAHPDQTCLELVIGQADNEAVAGIDVRYEEGQPVFMGQAQADADTVRLLNASNPLLISLDPPGQPGADRLRACFRLDAQRQLHVQVYDLLKRVELLPDSVVTRLVEGAADLQLESSGREPAILRAAAGEQRRLSLRGLGNLMTVLPPQAISLDAVAAALHSDEFYVRFAAAESLSRRGDRDARRILQETLTHGAAPQRASVAHHLHRFSWFAAGPMLRQALADPDPRVQESAIYSLCLLRGPDAYQLLLETLLNADDRLRLAAAWGLSRNPDPVSVPALALVLQAQETGIRVMALEALGETRSPAAIPVVRSVLDDPDLEVQYAAALSQIELEGEAGLPDLAWHIQSTGGARRAGLARALFHATNYLFMDVVNSPAFEPVLEALQAALQDDQPDARLAASMSLAWMHHPRPAAILDGAFRSEPDSETRSRLLMHAIHLSSPCGPALLAEALHDPDLAVRQAAEYLSQTYRMVA